MPDHSGLQNLLDLAGSIIEQGEGYWINAHQLLNDFFTEVDQVLGQAKLK